jgi:hypothetical protein
MVPGRLCWPVHRVAVSGDYPDGLHTILTCWTLEDVVDANAVIDALAAARAAPKGK